MSENENIVNEEVQNVEEKETKRVKPVPAEDFDWSCSTKKHDSYSDADRERMAAMYEKTMSQIGDHEVIDGTVVATTTSRAVFATTVPSMTSWSPI